MSQYMFTLVDGVDEKTGEPVQHVGVFCGPKHGFKGTDSHNPSFSRIRAIVLGEEPSPDEDEMAALFTPAEGVRRAVADANLSSRVAVENGEVLLDGEVMSNALTNHILKLLAEQSGDLTGWVRFLERIEANPNEHSRASLFAWLEALDAHDGGMTINPKNGFLVGYKGLQENEDGSLVSVNAGPAIVNGVEHKSGQVPNAVGSVIEMRREDVQHDPAIGCARGLHVGTWNYAHAWSRGAVVEVHVDPADVVSVPTDCGAQKMRCSKYEVIHVLQAPYSTATLPVDGSDDFDEDFEDYGSDDFDEDFDDFE